MLHQDAVPPTCPIFYWKHDPGPSATFQQPQLRAELMSNPLPPSLGSPLGSWDLPCRARVVGMEEELWPNVCCQEGPKSSWEGREMLVAQPALEQLYEPHSNILGRCTPSSV